MSTHRGGSFTKDELEYLQALPAVKNVTDNRITYSEVFKRSCVQRYRNGESPAKIFRDAGLDSSLIGYKRIERCIARWKKDFKSLTNDDADAGVAADSATANALPVDPDFAAQQFQPPLRLKRGRRDVRDILIAQQIDRIEELTRQIQQLKSQLAEATPPES